MALDAEVLIIGGGVVGTALARELSRYELRVLLLEREADFSFGTSKANSGIVHTGLHDRPGSLRAYFCVEGNRLYPALAEELDVLYRNNGALVVAQDEAELPRLAELAAQGRENGVPGLALFGPEELLRLEPNLSPSLAGGLLAPTGGIVVPFDMVYALAENAMANGVRVLLGTSVERIEAEGGSFLVGTGKGVFRAGLVINAAGLDAARVAGLIGDESFAIRPRRGEEYLLDRACEGLVRRTIFPLPTARSKGILVIPTVDGNIMLGPNARETDDAADTRTTAGGWEEISGVVRRLVPSLSRAVPITAFAGVRAASDRDDYIIGPAAGVPGFFHAAGIDSPGLTAFPAIARHLVELLREAGLRLRPKRDWNPRRRLVRLRLLDREAQAALVAQDPAYARIVCRCELVSEGEIRDAIRRGAATLDGVKLRTRCGMGRCQGGFCTPRIIRLLREELGLAPAEVTKRGADSNLLAGWLRGGGEG